MCFPINMFYNMLILTVIKYRLNANFIHFFRAYMFFQDWVHPFPEDDNSFRLQSRPGWQINKIPSIK